MTKSELTDALAERQKISRQTAEAVINTFFNEMQQALLDGGRIEIRGFGSFKVRSYKGYQGRNPRNLAVIEVPPKRLPVFKPSRLMESRLNASLEG
jgi:integration host factor subunit beta